MLRPSPNAVAHFRNVGHARHPCALLADIITRTDEQKRPTTALEGSIDIRSLAIGEGKGVEEDKHFILVEIDPLQIADRVQIVGCTDTAEIAPLSDHRLKMDVTCGIDRVERLRADKNADLGGRVTRLVQKPL